MMQQSHLKLFLGGIAISALLTMGIIYHVTSLIIISSIFLLLFLIMSIVGGAIAPVGMGILGENEMANGFLIPLICFVVVALYAFRGYRKI